MAVAPPSRPRVTLDAPTTNAGAMERLMLLETMTPARRGYDRADSIKAMRITRQIIENRLRRPAEYGAPGAATETEIVAVGTQFAGFGSYPTLDADLTGLLNLILAKAHDQKEPRQAEYSQFVLDAMTAATEAIPSGARYADATAWRTHDHGSPGGRFRLLVSLQGNDFYATNPVPPLPARHRHKAGHHHR